LFLTPGKIIRMGLPPFRIEVLTAISCVDFDECFGKRMVVDLGGFSRPAGLPDQPKRSAGE